MVKKIAFIAAIALVCIFAGTAFAQAELVDNGALAPAGDASGLPTGWYAEAWIDDALSMRVEAAEADGLPAVRVVALRDNDVRLCQEIPVEPDSCYEFTCEALTRDAMSGAGANLSVLEGFALSDPAPADGAWHTLRLVGRTGPDQESVTLALRVGGYSATSEGEAWFRNVSAIKLSETPANAQDLFLQEAEEGDSADFGGMVPAAMAFLFLLLAGGGWAWSRHFSRADSLRAKSENHQMHLIALLIGGVLLRALLSLIFYGHKTDLACFLGWSYRLNDLGMSNFYTSGFFADYLPGYMWVLRFLGWLAEILGIPYGSALHALYIKIPAILADTGLACLAYKLAGKHGWSPRRALAFAAIIALNPVLSFLTGGWGQVDSILILALLAPFYLIRDNKRILAGAVYGLAILIKPQALMMGPVLAAVYLLSIRGRGWEKRLLETVLAVFAAFLVIFLLSLPFQGTQEPLWVIRLAMGTATSYAYASIEAFNLLALFEGNWASVTAALGPLTYGQWGTIGIALSVVVSLWFYIRGRKRHPAAGLLAAGFCLCAIFTLGQYMHERYLLPGLALAFFAFLEYKDRRLFLSLLTLCVPFLLNCFMAFKIVEQPELRTAAYNAVAQAISLLEVAGFGYFAWVCFDILCRNRIQLSTEPEIPPLDGHKLPPEPDDGLVGQRIFTRRDRLFCWGLTAVYTVVTLIGLGTTKAPETYWYADQPGASVTLAFDEPVAVDRMMVYGGIGDADIAISYDDGRSTAFEVVNDNMFRWVAADAAFTAKTVTITLEQGQLWLNELAFFDAENNLLTPTVQGDPGTVEAHGPAALLDEQDQVPLEPHATNGMYFDELYHARTAYEHLHGIKPYENSHPPLGKVFIMAGIAVLGMNPLGWRIVGALFGVAMLPVFYALAKRMLKDSNYALVATGLFAFDFMHFTQTRIATIDVYAVFFILLMFYFMYQFYCMDWLAHGLKKTLRPLALAGLFFGLGAASKWICIYAGGGLAVVLAIFLVRQYRRYRAAEQPIKDYWMNLVKTLLWCCVFYIIVPVAIYLLSYLPYVLSEAKYGLSGIWSVQKFMYDYHSNLEATHFFSSSWWEWPWIRKPMWYYWSEVSPTGMASSISAFGNPAVWWAAAVGFFACAWRVITGKLRANNALIILFVAAGACYLPWVLVDRCTFIYHYFATVPFILLITVFLLKRWEDANPDLRWAKRVKWVWLAVALILFAVFYPVLSGMQVRAQYLVNLQWFPEWYFGRLA